ncbi:uncharacterized protein RHOBADRAFT_51269 [Rhodotorula graminis WP1]|uniref:C2H2-type domain-containing protein n=1 Tax=Rhodotorula graminis (strain WP1) TaxID=578459 RepID=A0A194SA02_RHOGW|nr:uncharacterized protein RHOBADRAFT_51269 [Rhodotorula graminis WP1]KPV77414.1 hypothetical protein RHOBADRAFT_51269 [Rhodotorula graminis WP1]
MDGPPPRRHSRGPYDDDRPPRRDGPPPSAYRDDGPRYDRPPPPTRGTDRRDDYERGAPPPRRTFDDDGPGALRRSFDRRGPPSPDYDARKRRRSPSPGGPSGPLPGGRLPARGYPPVRDSRDGPPPRRDLYHNGRGPSPPPRGRSRRDGPLLPPQAGYPHGADPYGQPFGAGPPPPLRPVLEPPMQLPQRVTKAYFSDWFRSTNPPSLADSTSALDDAYKKYCGDVARRELKALFDQTRTLGGEWFDEKYGVGPAREAERRDRRLKVERARRVGDWIERADKGEFDGLTFDFDEELARKPRIQPNAATQQAAAVPAGSSTNGASASPEQQPNVDLPAAPAASASPAPVAAAASVELQPSSPEFVVLPPRPEVLAIQGVPPTVAYKKLEAVFAAFPGFVRLALSEPLVNFDFARTGWAIFASAAEAAAALKSVQTGAANVDIQSGEDKVASAAAGDAEMSAAAHLASPAPSGEGAAVAVAGPVNGAHSLDPSTSTHVLAASSSMPFDLCAPGAVVSLLEAHEVRVRATPAAFCAPSRVAADLETVLRVVREAERRLELDGQAVEGRKGSEWIEEKKVQLARELEEKKEREGMGAPAHRIALAEVTKRTLDLALSYLREAHDVCYYCCAMTESPEQLLELCPRHVRRCDEFRNERRLNNELDFVQSFDEHVPLMQDTSALDIRDLGALSRDEELYRLASPHLKQEEEGKFRCKTCNKLFSARKFVEKHIGLKHPELFGDALEEVALFNNYVLDPLRLPTASFQIENYLPSILNPPAPPSTGRRALADRLGPPHKRSRRESGRGRGGPDGERDGPAAPPPKGAALDPRAQRGATAYADLDGPAGGGDPVALPY